MSKPITEDAIRALASEQSFERGVDYYRSGAIFNTRRVGDELRGQCRGSSYAAYRVSAVIGPGGVQSPYCDCPYDWGGICKHLVALLLTRLHHPEGFEAFAPVDERLASMSKEQLIGLIHEMLEREPDLDLPLQASPAAPVDLDAYRRQIDFVLQEDFPDLQELAFELEAIAGAAGRYAAQKNWEAAGGLYHLNLSEVIPIYEQLYDEESEISSILEACAEGLESCLDEGSPDPVARRSWFATLLDAEFKSIEMGGIDLTYSAGEILIEHATEEEWREIETRVRDKVNGMTGQYSGWARQALVSFLAERLEQDGRESEVSDLVFELGTEEQQANELIRLRRFEEAIAIAQEKFVNLPGLVIQFAENLAKAGGIREAIVYVTSQLESRDRSHYLGWLAQNAERTGDPETALRWRLSQMRESPNLEVYLSLRAIARELDRWDSLRQDVIGSLESEQGWDLLIAIALEEGELTRAIALLPKQKWLRHDLDVARAAERDQPQAAIEIYRREVDRRISHRGRENYRAAARLLQRVKELYLREGMPDKWKNYLSGLRHEHARLPALQDELNKAKL